ncbi:protease inhibitor I9 family protein [Neobacillus sp. DY30]|uniref:protease inhibitor I9 family protein n=1 Tax=Neobacillus sp. DY30 TaxID=3047871 RepID=UPI0024BF3168|nr:protease inhibitor I9 family protein [Neobacillus sp. DY30]WHX98513.1 protease inhibitor I9 family protein [Neobacillus sp. DY30]
MNKGKIKAFKVMTTAALTSLIFSSFTAFADNNDILSQTESADDIVEQGAPLLVKNNIETDQDDSIYKDIKNEAPTKEYKPDELVRFIVQLEQQAENEETVQNKRTLFKEKQDKVIDPISKQNNSKSNAHIKVKHRFFEGFNGFSVETEFQNLKEIQSIPGVTYVHVARTFEENMAASKELVQAQKVWEQYGYKGEGLLVAVVDSGIDYTHKDMTLSDAAKAKEKWTQESITKN